MKKVMLLCLLMLFVCLPVYAAELDDAKQIVNDCRDMNYRFESGLSYNKFNESYSDIYVKVRRFEDAYPGSELTKLLKDALEPYGDAKDVWKSTLSDNTANFKNMSVMAYKNKLEQKYPGIDLKIKKDILTVGERTGPVWNYQSTLSVLFDIGNQRIQDIGKQITAN